MAAEVRVKKPKKAPPVWLQAPLASAIRGAMTLPLLMGLRPATLMARELGRRYARARFNRKRLDRAVEHLGVAFPEWPGEQRRHYAVRSYQHLCQLGVELAYTGRLINHDGWIDHLAVTDIGIGLKDLIQGRPTILITGHCGNWELIGYAVAMLGFPMHAVYRPLDLKPLDQWVRQSRERQGLTLVNKFGAMHALPPAVSAGVPAGFVADQNGGDRGVFVPFFGRLTSTYKSIGLLALQFNATIVCGYARRLGAAERAPVGVMARSPADGAGTGMRYSAEIVDRFGPEEWNQHPDPLFYLTARYRRAIELMIRRAPEQYLWMHRIWRSRAPHERLNKPFPTSLRAKLEALPWMTAGELARVEEWSGRDRRVLHPHG